MALSRMFTRDACVGTVPTAPMRPTITVVDRIRMQGGLSDYTPSQACRGWERSGNHNVSRGGCCGHGSGKQRNLSANGRKISLGGHGKRCLGPLFNLVGRSMIPGACCGLEQTAISVPLFEMGLKHGECMVRWG